MYVTVMCDHVTWSMRYCGLVHARCRVKVALRHTYIALRMRSVVRHLHDIYAVKMVVHSCGSLNKSEHTNNQWLHACLLSAVVKAITIPAPFLVLWPISWSEM